MGYRKANTICKVQIVKLVLKKEQVKHCAELMRESGRLYSDIVYLHADGRKTNNWLSETQLCNVVKNTYRLHSQSVQSNVQKLIGNLDSAKSNREREKTEGKVKTKYPYLPKDRYCVTWKQFAIKVLDDNHIQLSNGRNNQPIVLPVPNKYTKEKISQVELNFKAGQYYLNLTIDTQKELPELSRLVRAAGVDLGEIHLTATCTEDGDCQIISGRHLRSIKQLRNKQFKEIKEKKKERRKEGKSTKSLSRAMKKISTKVKNQQRDLLHKTSRKVIEFCKESKVSQLYIGECSSTQDSPNIGMNNQKISQWTRGQLVKYLQDKGRREGIHTHLIPEDYSSKTCSICGNVKKSSVKGRTYKCANCKNEIHRDGNGGANICSRGRYGTYSKVQLFQIKYLQPIRLGSSSPTEPNGKVATIASV